MQQNKEEEKPDCARHKKEVAGISDMKALAKMIGDLHYETLAQLLKEIAKKVNEDSRKDWKGGRVQLANRLKSASVHIKKSHESMCEAWQISKPFMNTDYIKSKK